MKFHVMIREVHVQTVEVEAESEQKAIEKVQEGEGEYLEDSLEYSHTLEPDCWTVEKISEKGGESR
jgi:hypothetical protein